MSDKRKKIHRFFFPFESGAKSVLMNDPELVHQFCSVLRFKLGEQVMLVHEKNQALASVAKISKKEVLLDVLSVENVASEPLKKIVAYISMFKKEPFEWMLEKLTELGVSEIVPMETARTIRFPWKPLRYRTIIKEAAEQSGRGIIPFLSEPISYKEALKHASKNESNYIFELDVPALKTSKSKTIGYFIGPEGGFDESEINAAEAAGIQTAGLGKLTLRAETAAIVAAFKLLE